MNRFQTLNIITKTIDQPLPSNKAATTHYQEELNSRVVSAFASQSIDHNSRICSSQLSVSPEPITNEDPITFTKGS